tara:strand:+ start:4544 stop:5080 length:537 start_codon:yes stop_codon:yes gene_type:complete
MDYYILLIIIIISTLYYIFNYQNCKIFNNIKYCINKESSDAKFKTLIKIKKNFNLLIKYLNDKYKDHDVTININKNFKNDIIISELLNHKAIAYTKNKGEEMSFCLLDDYKKFNSLMFVALHELSHIATKDIGHTFKFWENFKFLLQCSRDIKIYTPENYNEIPVNYCGLDITHNPLF